MNKSPPYGRSFGSVWSILQDSAYSRPTVDGRLMNESKGKKTVGSYCTNRLAAVEKVRCTWPILRVVRQLIMNGSYIMTRQDLRTDNFLTVISLVSEKLSYP